MTSKSWVSVLIPTYKRAHLLNYVFDGLTNQTYKDFEVVVILKPSGDGTEGIVEKYKKLLNIKLIIQEKGYFTDALNLGLENANGGIIAYLDDDAIPLPNCIQSHIETYETSNVGGVAGDVIPAILKRNKPFPIKEKTSQVIPNYKPFLETIARKIWSRPLEGLEDYLVYISKAGTVAYNCNISHYAWYQTTKSLLGMGANMSVLSNAVKGFKLPPNSWILGLANEQFLGWHIWKQGYSLLFNPNAKVYHLTHGQTLTRNVTDVKKQILRQVEGQLLFYRLYGLEPHLSKMHRITWLIFSTLVSIKKTCKDKEIQQIIGIKSTFHSELLGLKWLLSKKLGLTYDLLNDLKAIGGLH